MAKILGRLKSLATLRVWLFLVFSGFFFFVLSRHLPWRDEYQTFLVATRTETWSEFWEAIRYERTPPLHYLLQRAAWPIFHSWVSPRTFIRLVTVPFSLLTFWLLFFRFRFSTVLALLLAGSLFFFREWGVISRSYAIGGGLLLLSLDFRNRGKLTVSRVLLAVGASAHLLFLLAAGAILAIDYFEDVRRSGMKGRGPTYWIVFIFSLALGAFVVQGLLAPEDAYFSSTIDFRNPLRFFSGTLRQFAITLFPVEMLNNDGTWVFEWSWNQTPLRFAWGLLFAIPFFAYFRKSKRILIHFAVVSFPVFLLFAFAYGPSLRHTGILFLLVVYFMAQVPAEKRPRVPAYLLATGPFLATLFWLFAWNPFNPRFAFSDSPTLALFFKNAGTIYAANDYLTFPAMAESGREVFDLGRNRVAKYPYFRGPIYSPEIDRICSKEGVSRFRPGDLFVLSYDDSENASRIESGCGSWELAYESGPMFATDEKFRMYRFRGGNVK